jgi:hypothetical protein
LTLYHIRTDDVGLGHSRRIDYVRDESASPPIATILARLVAMMGAASLARPVPGGVTGSRQDRKTTFEFDGLQKFDVGREQRGDLAGLAGR